MGRAAIVSAMIGLALAACTAQSPSGNPSAVSSLQPKVTAGAHGRHPEIRALIVSPPGTMRQGGSVTLRVDAVHPDELPLTYAWSATGGTLTTTNGPETKWQAPNAPGAFGLTVTVSDAQGGAAAVTQMLYPVSDS